MTKRQLKQWVQVDINIVLIEKERPNCFGIKFKEDELPPRVRIFNDYKLDLKGMKKLWEDNPHPTEDVGPLINFCNLVRQAVKLRNSVRDSNRKVDLLAYSVAENLGLFVVYQFFIKIEELSLKLGKLNCYIQPELMVVEDRETNKIDVMMFEDRGKENYGGAHGLFQICGEMLAGLQFNYKLDKRSNSHQILGIRLVGEMITFFTITTTRAQIIETITLGKSRDQIKVEMYPRQIENQQYYGLSLVDQRERKEIIKIINCWRAYISQLI
jgi:hypothetical protein